ncbi:DUF6221 family protein [Isoptericola sp. NPDC056605]|uniref:DUF6221 family protein n=1 Tax=Isoptericola sp. NPDC056605 TaxID=3345876 RepID=UPI00369712F4
MTTLTDFLTARYNDVERALALPDFIEEDSARGPGWGNRGHCPICNAYQFSGYESVTEDAWYEHAEDVHQRTRALAEVEAKRRIVEMHAGIADLDPTPAEIIGMQRSLGKVVAILALPYADHPDYDEEAWRP